MPSNLKKITQKTHRATKFIANFLQTPLQIGSVCSSSKSLASALTKGASPHSDGLIIDLGAGTGAISNYLVQSGFAPENILAIEVSQSLADIFKVRCPAVPLVIGDARELDSLIQKHAPEKKINMIVSSIPFRVLPKKVSKEIAAAVLDVVNQHECPLVQYSYVLWRFFPLREYGFVPHKSRLVVKNLPPARVEWYNLQRS